MLYFSVNHRGKGQLQSTLFGYLELWSDTIRHGVRASPVLLEIDQDTDP
jgi:hypothetical protein